MRGNSKDMLMSPASESADSRGECISYLDTPYSPSEGGPSIGEDGLKRSKRVQYHKDVLTGETIHSERTNVFR